MTGTAARVAQRFRTADVIGDPKQFLAEYEAVIRAAAERVPSGLAEKAKAVEAEINRIFLERSEENKRLPPGSSRPMLKLDTVPGYTELSTYDIRALTLVHNLPVKIQDPGHKLFLSILQTYSLPAPIRKKVEMASRLYLKTPRKPRRPKDALRIGEFWTFEVLDNLLAVYLDHADLARKAIQAGRNHSEEPDEAGGIATKMRVGSFILVNTGGFKPKVMENIADIVKKSEALIQSSGFGRCCYGNIQVTNTIHGRAGTAAFYLIESDELFIRANVKPSWDTIRTVCHELGHRYHKKFLAGKDRDIVRLYQKIDGQEVERSRKLRENKPPIGDTITEKGKTYRVIGVTWDRGGQKVQLQRVDDPTQMARISLEGYAALKGGGGRNFDEDPNYKGFVTDYAKKGGPDENFAEMFAFYCMGRLPVLQSGMFEELVFEGGLKAASTAARVAARFAAGLKV